MAKIARYGGIARYGDFRHILLLSPAGKHGFPPKMAVTQFSFDLFLKTHAKNSKNVYRAHFFLVHTTRNISLMTYFVIGMFGKTKTNTFFRKTQFTEAKSCAYDFKICSVLLKT